MRKIILNFFKAFVNLYEITFTVLYNVRLSDACATAILLAWTLCCCFLWCGLKVSLKVSCIFVSSSDNVC